MVPEGAPSFDLARLALAVEKTSVDVERALAALERIHDNDPAARSQLRALRNDPSYELAYAEPDPLVSVVIPTWNRAKELVERSIPSALRQTHANLEVIVVGDCSPAEVEDAVRGIEDPRVRFINLTVRGPYSEDQAQAWLAAGTPPYNAAVAAARGRWIAPLGDDDEFRPDHVEQLLQRAREDRLEFVYGRVLERQPDGHELTFGVFPPQRAQINLQAAIYHSGLRFMEMELGHALFRTPNDWGLIRRMMRVGVRMGMIEAETVVYWNSMRWKEVLEPQTDPATALAHLTATQQQLASAEQQLAVIGEQLASAEAQVVDSERQIGEAGTVIATQNDRLAKLEEQLNLSRADVVDLERRLRSADERSLSLTHDLETVLTSRSWRLTAPLRRRRNG